MPEPGRRLVGADVDADQVDAATRLAHNVFARFFEESLKEIAGILEAEGFEAPSLPVFEDGGDRYFKIHVYRFATRDATGEYSPGHLCGEFGIAPTASIAVNLEDYIPLVPATEAFLYSTLAHELFHAVQASYPQTDAALGGCLGDDDFVGPVREGTAEAIGAALARRKWPNYYREHAVSWSETGIRIARAGTDTVDPYLLGWRPYYFNFLDVREIPAEEERLQAAYETQSFWLHVADRYGIRFIDFLLRQPLSSDAARAMTSWLDEALKRYAPGTEGLYTAFPHFVAEFASHAGSKIPAEHFRYDDSMDLTVLRALPTPDGGDSPLTPPRGLHGWWIDHIGACERIEVVGGRYDTALSLFRLRPLATRCIELVWEDFLSDFKLAIEAEHGSLRLLDQIHIAIAYENHDGEETYCYDGVSEHYDDPLWTCLYEKPYITNGPEVLEYVKHWDDEAIVRGSGRRFIMLSNVARDAGATREIPADDPLLVRIGLVEAEGSDGREYGPPSSSPKGAIDVGIVMSPESLYGIAPSPKPAMQLLDIGIPIAGSDAAFGLAWSGPPPALGYTGPFRGIVSAPYLSDSTRVVSSLLCERHRDGVVGQITRFDRDHLWIDVAADLCEAMIPPRAGATYPVIEALQASLRIPYGWRYDSASAIADIVTPGIEVFIERHGRRLPLALGGAFAGGGDAGDSQGATAGDGQTSGDGTGSAIGAQSCDCSCEELAAFDARAEALDADPAAGNESRMALAGRMNQCVAQCMRPYMICRINP